VARFLHLQSGRASGPFIAVNAAAIPEGLIESELFGHVRGAFTDARDRKRGYFEMADGGTLFLDEIAETSPMVQVKLLRVLQEREVRPVGSDFALKVDLRIIAASNRDLRQAMAAGLFREDLFYRLNVFSIHLPPLRERQDDIPFLANYFLELVGERTGRTFRGFSEPAAAFLVNYAWPGNARELENVMERALALCPGSTIQREHLPESLVNIQTRSALERPERHLKEGLLALAAGHVEKEQLLEALRRTGGSRTEAAALLDIHRTTLYFRLKKYGINLADIGIRRKS